MNLGAEFNSQVVEALVQLALQIGQQGFEGHSVGTLIVVGVLREPFDHGSGAGHRVPAVAVGKAVRKGNGGDQGEGGPVVPGKPESGDPGGARSDPRAGPRRCGKAAAHRRRSARDRRPRDAH